VPFAGAKQLPNCITINHSTHVMEELPANVEETLTVLITYVKLRAFSGLTTERL
jgi:hypothetical protein